MTNEELVAELTKKGWKEVTKDVWTNQDLTVFTGSNILEVTLTVGLLIDEDHPANKETAQEFLESLPDRMERHARDLRNVE